MIYRILENIFILCIISVVFLGVWAFYIEPNMLAVTNYKIKDKNLKGIKIVLAGDFHVAPNQEKRLQKTVQKINDQKPDLILLVGDFVSGHERKMTLSAEAIAKNLANLEAEYGVYSVLGNHDWWIDGEEVTQELKKVGINVLADSNMTVKINDKVVYIAGVEDLSTRNSDIHSALKGTKDPTILLSHSPDIFPEVPAGVNLTVAGHLHGGQIRFPFIGFLFIPSKYGERYIYGLFEENDKKMIVTKGVGNSILPFRFNCKPEIVVIEFE